MLEEDLKNTQAELDLEDDLNDHDAPNLNKDLLEDQQHHASINVEVKIKN